MKLLTGLAVVGAVVFGYPMAIEETTNMCGAAESRLWKEVAAPEARNSPLGKLLLQGSNGDYTKQIVGDHKEFPTWFTCTAIYWMDVFDPSIKTKTQAVAQPPVYVMPPPQQLVTPPYKDQYFSKGNRNDMNRAIENQR